MTMPTSPSDPSAPRSELAAHLSAVSETLFLPLYALSLASRARRPVLVDPRAVEITTELDRELAGSSSRLFRRLARGRLPGLLVKTLALRVRRYDAWARQFLAASPDAVVVNLGCGLDGRHHRVDNGRMRWFDLDLPEVIALRRRFFPDGDRVRNIASSVLDFTWMEHLRPRPARVLFIAEGLFMYLQEPDVRRLVTTLRTEFPGAELIAELAGARIVRLMHTSLGRSKFRRRFGLSENVVYGFGVRDAHDLERWAPGIQLLEEWDYFVEEEMRHGLMRLFGALPLVRRAQWTARYRLG